MTELSLARCGDALPAGYPESLAEVKARIVATFSLFPHVLTTSNDLLH
ncbi:MAG TPA: hypothetical protein VIJ66_03700 [Solirubrobacteraceae bacterium]